MKIVDRDSAVIGGGEDPIPMNADHSNICKFSSRDDPLYQEVQPYLERFVNNAPTKIADRFHTQNTASIVSPFPAS
jgi:hypothetical protein